MKSVKQQLCCCSAGWGGDRALWMWWRDGNVRDTSRGELPHHAFFITSQKGPLHHSTVSVGNHTNHFVKTNVSTCWGDGICILWGQEGLWSHCIATPASECHCLTVIHARRTCHSYHVRVHGEPERPHGAAPDGLVMNHPGRWTVAALCGDSHTVT